MDKYKKLIGKRIRALREMKGYAQQEMLANALHKTYGLDIDASRISRWETGKQKLSAKYRKPLCELLGVTEEKLFALNDSEYIGPITGPYADQLIHAVNKADELHRLLALVLLTGNRKFVDKLAALGKEHAILGRVFLAALPPPVDSK